MATATYIHWKMAKKRSTKSTPPIVFALSRLYSLVFDTVFALFKLVLAPFEVSVSLSFLSLFFWKKPRKATKKQGFVILTEPLKSLEKKVKQSKNQGNKARSSKKTRKGTLRIFSGYF